MTENLPLTRVLRQAGWRANLELCASIQVQCWLTVLCSETRTNAKPENVVAHLRRHKLETITEKLDKKYYRYKNGFLGELEAGLILFLYAAFWVVLAEIAGLFTTRFFLPINILLVLKINGLIV